MYSNSEIEHPLITYLIEKRDDRAMLSALRHGLGLLPGAAPEMFPYIVRFLPERVSRWQEECLYSIASLFALHPLHTLHGNLGTHLRHLAKDLENDQATEWRFQNLLRAEPEMLPDLLRQMVSLLKAKEIPVNWHQLLWDIYSWSSPESHRNTARRWANDFFGNLNLDFALL